MTDVWMVKDMSGRLAPADEDAREALKSIKLGTDVKVKLTRPRNAKFHRKFFAMLKVVFDNQERYSNFEAFRAEVTMRAGFFVEHVHLTGKVSFSPRSISFASMDEGEFEDLYTKAVDICLEHFIPGTDRFDLEEAVMEFL